MLASHNLLHISLLLVCTLQCSMYVVCVNVCAVITSAYVSAWVCENWVSLHSRSYNISLENVHY